MKPSLIMTIMMYSCIIIVGILLGIYYLFGADTLLISLKAAFGINTIWLVYVLLHGTPHPTR